MKRGFEQKVFVLSGSSSGIGRALTHSLLESGAFVHGLDLKDAALHHENFRPHPIDVSSPEDWKRVAPTILQESGHVDCLINNAGISLLSETHRLSFAQWRKVLDINFLGTMLGTHAFYPAMVRRGKGQIANVSSVAGVSGYASAQAYAASKAAVIGFSQSLRHEAHARGILVSTICPGYVDTPIYGGEASPGLDEHKLKRLFPLRMISPEKAADCILKGLARRKRTVVFPLSGRLLHFSGLWFPDLLIPIHRALLRHLRACTESDGKPKKTSEIV